MRDDVMDVDTGRLGYDPCQFFDLDRALIRGTPGQQSTKRVAQTFLTSGLRLNAVIHFRCHEEAAPENVHSCTEICGIEKRGFLRKQDHRHAFDERWSVVQDASRPRDYALAPSLSLFLRQSCDDRLHPCIATKALVEPDGFDHRSEFPVERPIADAPD